MTTARIKELRQKQETVATEARARLDEISTATDESRAAELETQHDTAMAEYDRLGGLIEREERMAKIEKDGEERRARQRPISSGGGEQRGQDEGETLEYRHVFQKLFAMGGDPSELSAEERGVLRAGADKEAEFRTQTTTTPSAGGYTVPTELAAVMIKSMAAWGPMYDEDVCTTLNTSSGNQIDLPTVDDTTTPVQKHTEGADLTDDGGSDVTMGKKVLNAFVFDTEFVRFSFELAQDSIFNFEQLLGDLLGERLGRRANAELTVGDGNGDPNGIVTASSLGVTAASATAIAADELIDLQHSVDPAYRQSPKAGWQFNDQTLKIIRKLKDGEGRYLWDKGDFSQGIAGTILGYRYRVNQAMANVATGNKSIIFGDFGKYFVRKVGTPTIGILRERFWPNLGVAGLIRLDGELGDAAAVKHLIQA